jgi:hypothetical protein
MSLERTTRHKSAVMEMLAEAGEAMSSLGSNAYVLGAGLLAAGEVAIGRAIIERARTDLAAQYLAVHNRLAHILEELSNG